MHSPGGQRHTVVARVAIVIVWVLRFVGHYWARGGGGGQLAFARAAVSRRPTRCQDAALQMEYTCRSRRACACRPRQGSASTSQSMRNPTTSHRPERPQREGAPLRRVLNIGLPIEDDTPGQRRFALKWAFGVRIWAIPGSALALQRLRPVLCSTTILIPMQGQCSTCVGPVPHQSKTSTVPTQHQGCVNAAPTQGQCNTNAVPMSNQCSANATSVRTSTVAVENQRSTRAQYQCDTNAMPEAHRCVTNGVPVEQQWHIIAATMEVSKAPGSPAWADQRKHVWSDSASHVSDSEETLRNARFLMRRSWTLQSRSDPATDSRPKLSSASCAHAYESVADLCDAGQSEFCGDSRSDTPAGTEVLDVATSRCVPHYRFSAPMTPSRRHRQARAFRCVAERCREEIAALPQLNIQ